MGHGSDRSSGSLPCLFCRASSASFVMGRTVRVSRKAVDAIRQSPCARAPVHVDLNAWASLPDDLLDWLPLPQSLRPFLAAWSPARKSHRMQLEMRSSAFLQNTGRIPSPRRDRLPRSTRSSKPRSRPRRAAVATSRSMRTGAIACTAAPWVPVSSGSSACLARKNPIAVFAAMLPSQNRKRCSRRARVGVTRQHCSHRLTSAPIYIGRDLYARPVTFAGTSGLDLPPGRRERRHRS